MILPILLFSSLVSAFPTFSSMLSLRETAMAAASTAAAAAPYQYNWTFVYFQEKKSVSPDVVSVILRNSSDPLPVTTTNENSSTYDLGIPMPWSLMRLLFLGFIPREKQFVLEMSRWNFENNGSSGLPIAWATNTCLSHNTTHNKVLHCKMSIFKTSHFHVEYYRKSGDDSFGVKRRASLFDFFLPLPQKPDQNSPPSCDTDLLIGEYDLSEVQIRERGLKCFYAPEPLKIWDELKEKIMSIVPFSGYIRRWFFPTFDRDHITMNQTQSQNDTLPKYRDIVKPGYFDDLQSEMVRIMF